jgi:VCBS repeat-containing protein
MRRASIGLIAIFIVLQMFSPEAQGDVRKGPYLIYGGDPTQMTVLWQLDASQACTIRWGLTTSYSAGTASLEPHGDNQYECTITGLTPATLYYYQVDGVGSGVFRTAPENAAASVKLLAFSDPQGSPQGFDGACATMIDTFTRDPSFQTLAICAGDRADDDDEAMWDAQYFARPWENKLSFLTRVPVSGPRGNSERAGIVFKKYYPYHYVSDFYWSFDYGPAHIIVLDQFVNYAPGSPQYQWLVSDLAATSKPWKIITLHMPGWSADNVHENDPEVQDYIQPLCLQYGVDFVISGHNHYFARAVVGGVQHLTTGGACDYFSEPAGGDYIVSSEGTFNHLEFDIQGREASVTARRRDGSVIETFTVSHGASVRITSPQAGSTLVAGQATNVQARALSAGGTCTGVRFYADGQLIGTDDSDPYEVAWVPSSSPVSVSLAAEALITYLGSTETVASVPISVQISNTLPPVSLDVRVSQSTDDAEESASGRMYLDSSDLELVYDGSDQKVGMRFTGINIPQGSTVTNSYVQFRVDEVNTESTSLTIQGENTDQASPFTSARYGISARAKMAAAVTWNPNPWPVIGAAGTDQRTPNIASVIQEIVNRPGWVAGNSLATIITGTGHRTAVSYDGNPAGAPMLHIEYLPAAGNHAPVAVADAYSVNEDASLVMGAKGVLANDSDADSDTLTAALDAGPFHGTLTLDSSGGLTYTPSLNFNGADSFTYHANDGKTNSNVATATVTVNPVNDTPVANAQSVATAEDTSQAITLTGSDVDGDSLSYSIVTSPTHGTLTGTVPNLTYTPAANYSGADSLSFIINDGKVDSTPATVSITITAVNDLPVADAQSVTTAQNTAKAVTLTGSDIDGDSLTFAVNAQPANGTLSGIAPNLTYVPTANYSGADSFSFKVNDGRADSTPATVSITISAGNHAPMANAQSVTTAEDTSAAIALTGSDIDGDSLTFAVVTQPANGTLSGIAPNLTYAPTANYNGSDSFTFKVNDGKLDSTAATVSITVTPVNDMPVPDARAVTTAEDTAKDITLTGSDIDGDSLTYTVVAGPGHGTLSGAAPNVTYTPASNYNGLDSLTFKVNDGKIDSAPAIVSITITPINDPPVANAQSVATAQNTAKAITLTGSDADGDSLTFTVVTQPAHGTLSGNLPSVVYTPALNYSGPDSFTFKVNDGSLDSNLAAITITIEAAVNQAPIVNAGPDQVAVLSKSLMLNGSATDDGLPNGALTIVWSKVSGPGTPQFSSPNKAVTTVTFNKTGSYTLRLTATDGGGLSSSDDVIVNVKKK